MSDHGLDHCYSEPCAEHEAGQLFGKLRSGAPLNPEESMTFASYMMLFFGQLDAQKGWVKQLHLGAQRNANTRALREIGRTRASMRSAIGPRARLSSPISICSTRRTLCPR
jgi:glucuronate isomerase